MYDFSLDLAAEKIYHPQTKAYFKEVLSSYNNGNFRSVVVSLYTVVIADLIYKLKDLVDREEDAGAVKILDEIEKERNKDLASSKWENILIERILFNTKMLELHDKANIDALKAHRNLSAHPGITQDDLLFTPNKETARAHIRNMLEGILIKPSMFTSHIVDKFILSIPTLYEEWGGFWNEEGGYERTIKKKYLQYLNDQGVKKLFRTLWKFTFRLDNPETKENRDANCETLIILQKDFPGLIQASVEGERDYFSNVNLNKTQVNAMIDFFENGPRLYHLLDADFKVKFEGVVNRDIVKFSKAWFISENIEEHFSKVVAKLEESTDPITTGWYKIKKLAEAAGKSKLYFGLTLKNFAKSSTYTQSYDLFSKQVKPALREFSEVEFNELFSVMNNCSQIYALYNVSSLVDDVQSAALDSIGHEIDLTIYDKLSYLDVKKQG